MNGGKDRMQTGTVLKEVYELADPVSRGGQGWLWRARDRTTGAPVAVKLYPKDQMNPMEIRRYRREIRVLLLLPSHPHVATIRDFGEYRDYLYLVMGWIDGPSLKAKLASEPQPLMINIIEWTQQMCLGLAHIHQHKIVHRDIKPANMIVAAGETVTLVDFGIARFTDSTHTLNECIGSAPYMAPERWQQDAGDHRADLYSVGCVLYEMLTGAPPFGRSDGPRKDGLENAHLNVSPTPPRRRVHGIRPELDEVTMQLLEKIPANRPSSAAEVAMRLSKLLDDDTTADQLHDADERLRDLVRSRGPEDPQTVEARMRRAELIERSGDKTGAAREYDRIIDLCERRHGRLHPLTLAAREALFLLTAPPR